MRPALIAPDGAGTPSADIQGARRPGIRAAVRAGWKILVEGGGNALPVRITFQRPHPSQESICGVLKRGRADSNGHRLLTPTGLVVET